MRRVVAWLTPSHPGETFGARSTAYLMAAMSLLYFARYLSGDAAYLLAVGLFHAVVAVEAYWLPKTNLRQRSAWLLYLCMAGVLAVVALLRLTEDSLLTTVFIGISGAALVLSTMRHFVLARRVGASWPSSN